MLPSRQADLSVDMSEWFRSIGILREDGRLSLPVIERCPACRSLPGCGNCPGCQSGGVCHNLPPCSRCGSVQTVETEHLTRHPLHGELYGAVPEQELFQTSQGALFVQSVAAVGIIEPILGLEAEEGDETGAKPGEILVLSGWRRLLAARACGMPSVPVRLVDPIALPRRADVDLVIVSANLQRQKTFVEIKSEVQIWKRAIAEASIRRPKPWELRLAVAKMAGVSVRTVKKAEAETANDRLRSAQQKLRLPTSSANSLPSDRLTGESANVAKEGKSDRSLMSRLREEQQPGDLRGSDILSALVERNEPLLSDKRDEIVHSSLGRAAQTAEGRSILEIQEVPPLWPEDQSDDPPNVNRSASPNEVTAPRQPRSERARGVPQTPEVIRVRNLAVQLGAPDTLPFAEIPAVDLIIAAPSWLEPLVRPLLTPGHVPMVQDWRGRLRQCLQSWRQAIRPGGRLLLITPMSSPLHPGLPIVQAAIEELASSNWAIGGALALDDPGLHGPVYAVPHPDQVLPPKGPVRIIITAAPVLPEAEGTEEERWRQSWAAPLPGKRPRQVAAVEEAALNHLWKYAGPGRRTRWLPDFQPGLLYHLIRIFSRPDATVFLPELGGANLVRGCVRSDRSILAMAELAEQIDDVVARIRRDFEAEGSAGGLNADDRGFGFDTLTAVTGEQGVETVSEDTSA